MAKQNKFKPTFKVNGVSIRFPIWIDKDSVLDLSAGIDEAFSSGDARKIEHYRSLAETKDHGYLNAVMKAKGLT